MPKPILTIVDERMVISPGPSHFLSMGAHLMDLTGERQRLWDAAQRGGEGPDVLGARALSMFQEKGVTHLLDLGCGRGPDPALFTRAGICVITVDLSGFEQDLTDERKEEAESCGALLERNIRERLPSSRSSVDAICSHLFVCADLRQDEMLDIMWRCLQALVPGGLMVMSVPRVGDPACGTGTRCKEGQWIEDRGFVSRYFDEDRIVKVARGFHVLWVREYEDEAAPHPGAKYEVVLMRPG